MRPTANKRRPRTRSSIRLCEEKYCCPFLESKAEFFCKDCNSAQCHDCERSIHSRKLEYDFHIRYRLDDIPDLKLCQAKKINLICTFRNFPDLWCNNCHLQFCYTCYDTYHSSGKKKSHKNVSFAYHEKKLKEEINKKCGLDLHDSSELYEDALSESDCNNMIKPQTPFSLADDSLTYCSFPQEGDELERNMAFTSSTGIDFNDQRHSLNNFGTSRPDICVDAELPCAFNKIAMEDSLHEPIVKSFYLVDDQEALQVKNAHEFVEKLGCDEKDKFKVVSIFGNTGDGKSFTLNHTFFNGDEVFCTSPSQTSCTLGVWCALHPQTKSVVIDTEGLLGSSSNENQRTRLLLKILAVSDIAIFRTRAERLHNDMFIFLSNASKAYCKHFAKELKSASQKYGIPESSLGPTLIVFQETTHTETIKDSKEKSAVGILREKFLESKNPIDAFRNICYVGIKTESLPTNFHPLQKAIYQQLEDNSVRAPREPRIIFNSLKALNDKFSDKIETPQLNSFPDQYFTCTSKCLACRARCTLSMNHDIDEQLHDAGRDIRCQYQSQYGNKIFMCKTCLRNKEESIVVPKTSSSSDSTWLGFTKYIWSGYVYECSKCGVIYRSREHWYGNEEEEKVLHVEFTHVWPQGPSSLDKTHNAARKVLEGFSTVADTISSVSLRPTKYIAEWTADQISPTYWVPNSEITNCSNCELLFTCNESKHHCRACGKGVCTSCSSKQRPVPERGWGPNPVRICDKCFEESDSEPLQETMTARKVGEAMSSTFSAVASLFEYPKGMIKNSARPEYWVPDDQIKSCCVCTAEFGPRLAIHHCRACGQGVCEECSPSKRKVEFRGWDYPVRVCKKCEKKTDKV